MYPTFSNWKGAFLQLSSLMICKKRIMALLWNSLNLSKIRSHFFQEERIAIRWIFSSSVPSDLAPLKQFLWEGAVHFFEKQLKYKIIAFWNVVTKWDIVGLWAQRSLLWKFNTFGQSRDYSPLTCPIYSNQPKAMKADQPR